MRPPAWTYAPTSQQSATSANPGAFQRQMVTGGSSQWIQYLSCISKNLSQILTMNSLHFQFPWFCHIYMNTSAGVFPRQMVTEGSSNGNPWSFDPTSRRSRHQVGVYCRLLIHRMKNQGSEIYDHRKECFSISRIFVQLIIQACWFSLVANVSPSSIWNKWVFKTSFHSFSRNNPKTPTPTLFIWSKWFLYLKHFLKCVLYL